MKTLLPIIAEHRINQRHLCAQVRAHCVLGCVKDPQKGGAPSQGQPLGHRKRVELTVMPLAVPWACFQQQQNDPMQRTDKPGVYQAPRILSFFYVLTL